jgi:hypothetical protein
MHPIQLAFWEKHGLPEEMRMHGDANIIKEKLFRVAGHMLEAAPYDLELRAGKVGVKGAPGMEK